jgi:hypothetical protein
MKVSEFLRKYEITGQVPEPDDPLVSFWAGWLIGCAHGRTDAVGTMAEAVTFARQAAEFIEQAK